MLRILAPFIKIFLKLILLRRYRTYILALKKPKAAQDKTLKQILNLYNLSSYGKEKGLASGYDQFKNSAPIIRYEDIGEQIYEMKHRGQNYFSPSPVIFYEPTSGSSGAKKLIPYTWSLKSTFSRMFSLWVYDLLKYGPSFNYGKFYFSVSPQFKNSDEGLEDDTEYLEGFFSWFLKPFFITPKKIKKLNDPLAFKKVLALHLISEEKLEIISIWNPSTFTILLDFINENRKELLLDLEKGVTHQEGLTFKFKKPSEERVEVIKNAQICDFWPKLKFISSWGSMEAEQGFNKLQKIFPEVYVQPKGLLATEAPLTIPIINAEGFVPLINTIFFEFKTSSGDILRLHELIGGETYKVIISTLGGLYRYALGDKVKVSQFYLETPCLEFVGRGSDTSDLFGEKLNSNYLKSVVNKFDNNKFYTFYPTRIDEDHGFYTLLTDDNSSILEERVEAALMEAFHYQVARKLGTLRPVKVIFHKLMNDKVLEYFQKEKGMKLGDIKPRVLLKDFDQTYLRDIS